MPVAKIDDDENEKLDIKRHSEININILDSLENKFHSQEDTAYLFFSVLVANLLAVSCGTINTWPSSVFPKLQSPNDSPLDAPVTTIQLSLIASLCDITQIFGPFVYVFVNETYGRKLCHISISILYLVANTILGFTSKVWVYYLARMLQGIAAGGTLAFVPTYVSEITEDHNRGKQMVTFVTCLSIGMLSNYVIGPFVTLKSFHFINLTPSLLFLFLSKFTPESPVYLVKKKEMQKAELVLKKLRKKTPAEIFQDVTILEKHIFISKNIKLSKFDTIKSKSFQKAVVLSACLLSSQSLLGIMTVIGFTQQIFTETGSTIPPEYLPIITGTYLVIITFVVSSFVVDKFKRKSLMLFGTVGITFALSLITLFFFLKKYVPESVKYSFWIPLTFFILYFTCLQFFGPLTWIVSNEIFSTYSRPFGMSISSSIFLVTIFASAFLFPILSEAWGLPEVFLIHNGFSALIFLFVLFFIPETKNKNYYEIQELMTKPKWIVTECK